MISRSLNAGVNEIRHWGRSYSSIGETIVYAKLLHAMARISLRRRDIPSDAESSARNLHDLAWGRKMSTASSIRATHELEQANRLRRPFPFTPPTLEKAISIHKLSDIIKGDFHLGIALDFVPSLLEFTHDSTFSALKIVGRNTGVYHYGGSEESLKFDIHWYGDETEKDHETVIKKCRRIEALSKANGFESGPPILYIQWGKEENPMLKHHHFILERSNYKLTNFTSTRITPDKRFSYKLNPVHAIQEVQFRRVSSSQLTYEKIIYGNL